MFPRTNNRKAISVVLTTMIILVASVVLGTGVVIYGTSLFQTGASEEKITTQGVKLWVNATNQTGVTWGAAGVRNSGDKLVSVDQILVRGESVPYTSWYVDSNQTTVSTDIFQAQYVYTTTNTGGDLTDSTTWSGTAACNVGTVKKIDFDGAGGKAGLCLVQASGPTSLTPGEKLVVYFRVPDGIMSPVDAGAATSVSIFAGKTGAPVSVTVANP